MTLALLTDTTCELILPWRNAPAVRQGMYSHHEISLQEHRAWFLRMQYDPSVRYFLWHDVAGTPQGVVYFTALNAIQGSAFWGLYTSPTAPPGTGMRMALEALELAFAALNLVKLNAEAMTTNPRSVSFHKKIGFIEEGLFREQYFDGERRIDVIRLGMLANEWPRHRVCLQARIAELDAPVTLLELPPLENSDP